MTKKVLDSEDNNSFYVEPELEDNSIDPTFLPFKKMYSAVLERAFLDLKGKDREFALDALEWFSGEKVDDPELMSFQFVCEVLDIDFIKIQHQALSVTPTLL